MVIDPTDNEALRWTLLAGARCNEARLLRDDGRWQVAGDPTEGALLAVAAKGGLDVAALRAGYPRLATIPFSADRQYMASLHEAEDGMPMVVLAKGAAERVLAMCDTQMDEDGTVRPVDREAVLVAAEALAGRGLRVLATAMSPTDDPSVLDEETLPGTLALTGLQAMLDPPRAAAAGTVGGRTAPRARPAS